MIADSWIQVLIRELIGVKTSGAGLLGVRLLVSCGEDAHRLGRARTWLFGVIRSQLDRCSGGVIRR